MELSSIKFLQSEQKTSIEDELQESIKKCVAIRGAIAFWSIKIGFSDELLEKLANPKSYICVDIHRPTDVDALSQFVEKDANIYLFLYRKDTGKFPLLHTKFLIFNLDNGQVEIWLGSQNFTYSALEGKNIESTTVITTSTDSDLYKSLLSYLEFIKKTCEEVGTRLYPKIGGKFNPKDECINFYKKLQGSFDYQEETHQVLDIVCSNVEQFKTIHKEQGYTLVIIYDYEKKLNLNVGQELLLRVLDKDGRYVCYKSEIMTTGIIAPIEEQTNSHVTSYSDSKGKKYNITSCIISENKLIPALATQLPNKDKTYQFQIEFIIKISGQFTGGELALSSRTDFWKKPSLHERNSLPFLKANNNEDIKIPKSPKKVLHESTYPFDKLKQNKDGRREEIINNIINVLSKAENIDFELKPKTKHNNSMKLNGRQTIIRKMVSLQKKEKGEQSDLNL